MSREDTKIVVLSPASGAPEPLRPAKGKGGRGQRAEYNPVNREAIEKITIWAMTPELYRFPATAKELAAQLNISASWVSKIKKRLPDSMPEFLNMAEDEALANHRDVVRMITAQAMAGNNKAQQLYMKHIAEKRKQREQGNFQFRSDVVNFGINLVLGNKAESATTNPVINGNDYKQLEEQGAEQNESNDREELP